MAGAAVAVALLMASPAAGQSAPAQQKKAAKDSKPKAAAGKDAKNGKGASKDAAKATGDRPAPGTPEHEEWLRVKYQILNMFGRNNEFPPKETWKDYPPVTGRVMVEIASDAQSGQQHRVLAIHSLAHFPETPSAYNTCDAIARSETETKFFRDAAMGCLVYGYPARAVPALKEIASSGERGIRLSAVSGLTQLKTKEADAVLEKLLPGVSEPVARQMIEKRLKEARGG